MVGRRHSRTLDTLTWEKSSLLDGEVPDAVARIKETHDEVHTIGSADLVQTPLRHDLVDRFELILYPVLLGRRRLRSTPQRRVSRRGRMLDP